MANLFALCRNGDVAVKHVRVTQPVQAKIEGIFQGQATAFLDGIAEEVEFGGGWKPDLDEVLVIDAPEEVALMNAALDGNPIELPSIDAANFSNEGIRALFTSLGTGANRRILIQVFSANQILSRKFSLMLDGNTFKELTEPAFTLETGLAAIVEDNKLKFKSFFNVKKIFQLAQFYQEATDQQVETFCEHNSLHVGDIVAFKEQADQPIRKLVHAIGKAGVLDQYPVTDIIEKANYLGLNLEEVNGSIDMPSDKKEIKILLRFLDDGIYEALLTSKRYVTNSKRLLA